jgi:hypothetical protein
VTREESQLKAGLPPEWRPHQNNGKYETVDEFASPE